MLVFINYWTEKCTVKHWKSRLLWGPIQPPIHWALRAISPGVKQPRREADHLLPCSAEVENEWSYTSTPPYAFTTAMTLLPLQLPAYSWNQNVCQGDIFEPNYTKCYLLLWIQWAFWKILQNYLHCGLLDYDRV